MAFYQISQYCEEISNADIVCIDGNVSSETMQFICQLCSGNQVKGEFCIKTLSQDNNFCLMICSGACARIPTIWPPLLPSQDGLIRQMFSYDRGKLVFELTISVWENGHRTTVLEMLGWRSNLISNAATLNMQKNYLEMLMKLAKIQFLVDCRVVRLMGIVQLSSLHIAL